MQEFLSKVAWIELGPFYPIVPEMKMLGDLSHVMLA